MRVSVCIEDGVAQDGERGGIAAGSMPFSVGILASVVAGIALMVLSVALVLGITSGGKSE